MRITKDLTYKIIDQLVKPITDKIDENDCKISKIIQDYVLKDCPKEVINLWKQKSKWINVETNISFNFLGQHSWCYFPKKEYTPIKKSNIVIEDRVIAEQIQVIVNSNIDLKKKSKELSKELEITILKLGTFARIREQFPEAAELLPDENKRTEIALNIQDVRNKLKNIP